MTHRVSPSGSRWEPVPTTSEPSTSLAAGTAPDRELARRRRQPVLVALVALLSLGTSS